MNLRNPLEPKTVECTLCNTHESEFCLTHRERDFYQCRNCDLVFVPAQFHLAFQEEKNEYDRHENDAENEGYVNFLNRALVPLRELLKPGMEGLDFGSGPGPVLSDLLNKEGYTTSIWDPIYAPDESTLKRKYDFITCTEVVEHFCNPYEGWSQLAKLLEDGGYLVVMTLLCNANTNFKEWWYKNDPTHVSFYSIKTIEWISRKFALNLIFEDEDRVLLFQKRFK